MEYLAVISEMFFPYIDISYGLDGNAAVQVILCLMNIWLCIVSRETLWEQEGVKSYN